MEGWSRGGMMTYLALTRTKRIAAADRLWRGRSGRRNQTAAEMGDSECHRRTSARLRDEQGAGAAARSAIHCGRRLAKDADPAAGGHCRLARESDELIARQAEKLYQQRHPFRLVMFQGGDHGLSEHRDERDRIPWTGSIPTCTTANRGQVSSRTADETPQMDEVCEEITATLGG